MSLSKSAFRRYKVIDELLRNKYRNYPKMEDIIEACREKLDFEPTRETIQKDIAHMKAPAPRGFDAPIYFNRLHHGYEYTDPNYSISGIRIQPEEMDAIIEAVDLIKAIGKSRVSDKFNHAIEKLLSTSLAENQDKTTEFPAIQVMTPPPSRGFELFSLLLDATKHQQVLSFIYFSYETREFESIILHPFLIKEFDNKWYIIGHCEKSNSVNTYGFDRITDPLILNKTYQRTRKEILHCIFHDQYGVYPINKIEPEEITIHADQLSTHYFQAYPIHKSQHIHKFSSGSSTITFNVVPTIELARFLLSQGNSIQIIGPKEFRDFTFTLKK